MSSLQAGVKQKPERRTQKERRDQAQQSILNATLECLAEKGYANTSISEIVKKAGVSRGGLLHHYPSKAELVASAMHFFYEDRPLTKTTTSYSNESEALRDHMDALKVWTTKTFPVRIEFMVAARTNPDLAAAFANRSTEETEEFLPEFSSCENPRLMEALVGTFFLGQSLMNIVLPESTNEIFQQFVDVLDFYIHSDKIN